VTPLLDRVTAVTGSYRLVAPKTLVRRLDAS
jgi:hypothetical protein